MATLVNKEMEMLYDDVVLKAKKIVYLSYRSSDRLLNGYVELKEKVFYMVQEPSQAHKHCDYCYVYMLARAGRHSYNFTTEEMVKQAMDWADDKGRLRRYYLNEDNHDGFLFQGPDDQWYMMIHGDGYFWVWTCDEPKIEEYNAAYRMVSLEVIDLED